MCSGYQGKNDNIHAIYGAGNYFRSPEYKKLEMLSHTRHSQGYSRKKDHVTKFHEYVPSIDDTFTKPSNLGERPGFQKRKQNGEAPDLTVDRFAICATWTDRNTARRDKDMDFYIYIFQIIR